MYADQEATVRTRHGTMCWFKTGKEYNKAVYCHPAYLTYMQSTSHKMPGWMKHKLEWRLRGEVSITSDMQMTPPLWCKEDLKSLLVKVKDESEKAGLKLNIQKTKILESDPITSWQIDGETMETVADFIFLGSKITVDSECSHEIKKNTCSLGRKATANLDSILKSRDIILPTKVHIVKATVFPVVMYGHESWTIKKAERRRTDAFKLWCWRRLGSPLDCKRSNQSILKETNPQYSLEGLGLKLKLQYFGHLMWRADSLEKTLMLGKIERRRRRAWQRMRWLDGIIDSMDMRLSKLQEMMKDRTFGVLQSMESQRVEHDWATEQQQQRKVSSLTTV